MVAESFQYFPTNQRVPLFYVEIDPSQAGTTPIDERAILFGYSERGSPNNLAVHRLTNRNRAAELFGPGAQIASMDRTFRKGNPTQEVIAISVAEPAGGQEATGQILLSAQPLSAGTLSLYVDATRYQIGVAVNEGLNTIATKIANAINGDAFTPVVATANAAGVDIKAKWKGLSGNDIDVRFNHLGLDGGESFPNGFSADIMPMQGGTGSPDLDGLAGALGDEAFDFAAFAWTDTASLNWFQELMKDATGGRWAWDKMLYGGGFSCRGGSTAEISTFGNSRNDPHLSLMHRQGSPTAPWNIATAYTARAAAFLQNDPVLPFNSGILTGVLAPLRANRYESGEENVLLHDGVSTFRAGGDNVVRISRAITTYQTNPLGSDDTAFLNVQVPFTLARINRRLRGFVEGTYGRHGVVNDGTRYRAGLRRVSPSIIRAALINQYRLMENDGLVENTALFSENLIVERNPNNPGRLDVLFTPDLANGLYIFAVLNQFRLQFPQSA